MALHIDKAPVSMQIGEYVSRKLIPAETAIWVIGGSKPGVMTRRAKWAFGGRLEAEAYVKENGGEIADFEQAIRASYEDMYEDTRMIRERRKMKRTSSRKDKP
jgi:nitrous oxide reductase accessory protein NosL